MSRLPRWTIVALLPAVLVVGVLIGVALKVYWLGDVPQLNQPVAANQSSRPSDKSVQTAPTVVVGSNSSENPTASPTGGVPTPPPSAPVVTSRPPAAPHTRGPAAAYGNPSTIYRSPSVPPSIAATIWLLNQDFRTAAIGNTALRVKEYQLMSSERGKVLVGVVPVTEAARWEQAIKYASKPLKTWLETVTSQITPNEYGEGMSNMQMIWAILDVVDQKPDGFAAHELTQVDGRWLVMRPLAATVGLGEGVGDVYLRDPLTFQGTNTRPLGNSWAWEVYVPIVKYDPKTRTLGPGN